MGRERLKKRKRHKLIEWESGVKDREEEIEGKGENVASTFPRNIQREREKERGGQKDGEQM